MEEYEHSPYVQETTTIPCMRCRKPFKSKDKIRNRICDRCGKINAKAHTYVIKGRNEPTDDR